MTKAVHVGIKDPEARYVLIVSLDFENASLECKKIFEALKVRSTPMDEWTLNTMNVQTFDYHTETWVVEAISKGMRKPQMSNVLNVVE